MQLLREKYWAVFSLKEISGRKSNAEHSSLGLHYNYRFHSSYCYIVAWSTGEKYINLNLFKTNMIVSSEIIPELCTLYISLLETYELGNAIIPMLLIKK